MVSSAVGKAAQRERDKSPSHENEASVNQQQTATIIRTIVYRQISNIQSGESPGFISALKISGDGSRIIFTGDQPGKIFTIKSDGSDLIQVFDYASISLDRWWQPHIDISYDGWKIIWTDGVGEIFIADYDGTDLKRIATTFPGEYGGTEGPNFPLTPRITADGTRVFFIHRGGGPDIAGGYIIEADGTGQSQLFSYRQMSQQLFGQSGSEINGFWAFVNEFDISSNGSYMVFGTINFGAPGHTITFVSSGLQLKKATDFTHQSNTYAISPADDKICTAQLVSGEGRTALVSMNYDGSNLIEIGKNIGDGYVYNMTANSLQVLAGGMSLFNTDGSGQLDLVVSPLTYSGGLEDPFYRAGIGLTQSISADGRKLSFKTEPYNLPQRIWVADINPNPTDDVPSISDVNFTPNWVLTDGTSSSTFSAYVSGGPEGVSYVSFDCFRDGVYKPGYVRDFLYDDGTHGDATAGDGMYTNNYVTRYLAPPDPVNPFIIRITAISGNGKKITAVDVAPFFVLDQAPSGSAPVISLITPSSGIAGTQATITGQNFEINTSYNIVLFGNRQAYVKSVNAERTNMEVIVPGDLPAGIVPVTVTVAAQTSNSIDFNILTSVKEKLNPPIEFTLNQNYPNPFNPTTKISWQSPVSSRQILKVYDVLGNEIAILVNEEMEAGYHSADFNASDLPSGVYFYQLRVGGFVETKKMILLK
jgi:hypothetical protein